MSLQGVREILGLCAVPGNSWEAIVTLSKPTPVLMRAQSHLVLWGCLASHSWEAFGVMCGCGRAQELVLLPCAGHSVYLLQSGTQVQISPKAEVCKDTDFWCGLLWRLASNERGEVSDSGLDLSQIWVKQDKYKSKDIAGWISLVLY